MLGTQIMERTKNLFPSFRKDEDGSILMLSLLLFLGMTVFGGIAVDLANYERTRTALQSHLDNAVLAAASLSQDLDPEVVITKLRGRSRCEIGLPALAIRIVIYS